MADASGSAGPAASTLLAVVRALLALQLASAALPGTWTWAQDLPRFVPPWAGFTAVLILLAAALPPVAGMVASRLGAAGDLVRRRPLAAAVAWGFALAVLVLALPDRTRFVGDFQIREAAIRGGAPGAELFPQAFPLDLALHVTLPRAVASATGADLVVVHRALGGLEAALFGACTVALAAALGAGGVAAAACVAVASGGGALALFTGYPKAFAELALFAAMFAAAGAWWIRRGRGLGVACLAITGAVLAHRSAVLWLPAWGWLVALAWRRAAGRERRQASIAVAAAAPVAVLAWLSPLAMSAAATIDREHLMPGGAGVTGALAGALRPRRLLDAAQAALWFAPLAPALALAPWVRDREERVVLRFLLLFAVPLAAMFVLVLPRQGVPRDWDVYAAAGVALAAAAAWVCASVAARSRRAVAIAALAIALAMVPALLALVSAARPGDGMRRVEALIAGPPQRSDAERGLAWSFVAIARHGDGDHHGSLAAYRRAAELAPSPRVLQLLAGEAVEVEDWGTATATYRRMAERAPEFAAWLAMSRTAQMGRDWRSMLLGAEQALRMEPSDGEARQLAAIARDSMAAGR